MRDLVCRFSTASRVSMATVAVDALGRRVSIHGSSVYRFEPWSTDGLVLLGLRSTWFSVVHE